MASGITVIKGHSTGRPAKTPNPCFCMPSYNTAVFRPILLLVKLFLVHYSLEVYVVTYESLKRNIISYSDSLIHRSLCKLQIKSHAAIATCSSDDVPLFGVEVGLFFQLYGAFSTTITSFGLTQPLPDSFQSIDERI